jgi:RNA polymerase sigma-70 factor (ECF subfamily)
MTGKGRFCLNPLPNIYTDFAIDLLTFRCSFSILESDSIQIGIGRSNPRPDVSAYSDYNDQELLDAIRRNNERAFSELFKRYGKVIYKMAYARLRSRAAAEEIVQNLFIFLWDKRTTVSIVNFPSYFYVAVKHRVLGVIESQIVHKKYWDYYKKFIPRHENSTERAIAFNELMASLEEQVERLPDKSKEVFRLNHFEGHSVSEIATSLNLSEKAIQYHLTRSLKELRLHLKDFIVSLGILLGVLIS